MSAEAGSRGLHETRKEKEKKKMKGKKRKET